MTRFSTLPIRTQLLLLALLLTLPSLGIIVHSGLETRAADYQKAIIETQKLADSLAETQEDIARESRQLGSLLTELPEVRNPGSGKIRSILATAIKQNPQYNNILITDRSGIVRVSASPITERISVADRLYFTAARDTLRFSAGEYVVARTTGKPTIHMATPIVINGRFEGVVALSIDLDVMRAILGRSQLPANANYVMADRSGIIINRGRALGQEEGKPIQSAELKKMEQGPDRLSYEFSLKGERRVVTYRKIRLEGEQTPYMYVRAGMSLKQAVAAANRQLFYNLMTLMPFVMLAFAIVLFIGKRSIADRVKTLREASLKIADGDLEFRVAPLVQGGELGELALSFDHMASNLAEYLDEIRQAQMQISNLNAELEQKVAKRTAQLEALVKEQEAFNYTVSHDLRAPLRHINGFSTILVEEFGEDISPQCRLYLQRICAASTKMEALIDNLLEFSRINREVMTPTTVDLGSIAAEILQTHSEMEPARSVTLNIAADLTARGDANLLRMALQNLLDNAWKYTAKTADPLIEMGKSTINGEVVYFVRDNGTGFDMEYKDKLFAVFQRLHGNDYEGTGIGLATVERIIQRHNGRIWAEGKPGEGATFYFTLPDPPSRSGSV